MFKKNYFARNLLNMMPNSEQSVHEKKLTEVMKRLKVENYKFNWDRTGCFVEFHYKENFYRLEHSVQKAKRKGIILRNGLDCLMELTQSLEELCGIIDRGMNDFETWISGMKQSPSETKQPEYQEEFEIRYKTMGRQNFTEYNRDEVKEAIPFGTRASLREIEKNQMNQRSLGDNARF
ncbi:hypothetical protein D8M04_14075 [Oceanobacillus piezotolerans]|uniref:Uncharacterized protein n=1 Tax=Oceanobacillus piezotolerans TaxID=2448030 RepID=A0A498D398_9BACI|nr:hypothetical protein [Oceanobacillus piezotolerans]RLL42681.1 hypothetical protein D8M04_14075 [Oceanobacillus piezotolerans]